MVQYYKKLWLKGIEYIETTTFRTCHVSVVESEHVAPLGALKLWGFRYPGVPAPAQGGFGHSGL